jgi:hypothetical protein
MVDSHGARNDLQHNRCMSPSQLRPYPQAVSTQFVTSSGTAFTLKRYAVACGLVPVNVSIVFTVRVIEIELVPLSVMVSA